MFIDILIIFMLVSIVIRARQTGLVRQLLAAAGFITGLFVGAALQPYAMNYADTTLSRALLSLAVTLGFALVLMRFGELAGVWVKRKLVTIMPLNKADGLLGSLAGAATLLAAVWLITPLLTSLPSESIRQSLDRSYIVAGLNRSLPSAPDFISRIDRIINPNGFPDVFAGIERQPLQPDAPLPSLGDLQAAVQAARPSVVKIEGRGCGGIVEGSGFVARDGIVVTNAHVIAGVANPSVLDTAGEHRATVIWFDPQLDMAVLRTSGLAGGPLELNTDIAEQGSAAAVLGYPGGGGFTAGPATILDQFTATGRDIYGSGSSRRSVYEVRADIIPGNSGGPLINQQGQVIGLVFAESTNYQQVGYAITAPPVANGLQQALARNQPVSSGSCAQ